MLLFQLIFTLQSEDPNLQSLPARCTADRQTAELFPTLIELMRAEGDPRPAAPR